MYLLVFLLGIILVLTYTYYKGRCNENYWKKRGAKFYQRNKVVGPFWDFLTTDRALFEIFGDMYKEYPDEPAIGFGAFSTPSIFTNNIKNVQYVLQGSMFYDRGIDYHEKDYLADNLLFMKDARWKLMRQKLTPLFTSTKLKSMYYIMDKSSQDFIKYLQKHPEKQKGDTYNTLSTFCCAAIGGAVFGVGSESTFDSPFLEMTTKAFSSNFWKNIRFAISNVSPSLFKVLELKLFKEFEPFFIGAMKQVFRAREEEGVKKHDFIDLCLGLKKDGVMKNDDSGLQLEPTDELLAAQGFFFFIAGVEPTTTSVFGALVEIGRHPEIQRRVQEEIDSVFEKHNGELSYDAVAEMEYLDKVLSESLRMYPPIGFAIRRCTEATNLPEGNIRIEKGTRVFTPSHAFHYDARYFEDPYIFNPERHSEEAKRNLGVVYQPFGFGSRICIGMRYARLQVKSALAHILRNFNLETRVGPGGIKYGKDNIQVRIKNVDVMYTPRNVKTTYE